MHAPIDLLLQHNTNCYIARVNTKRDWLICGHVTSDKSNVSPWQQVKNCCRPRPATYTDK
jgi:hypothetical protein